MAKSVRRPLIFLCVVLVLIIAFMTIANQIQSDFGNVDIRLISIDAGAVGGEIIGKLYTPVAATPENPAPAVLLMHGYQNDKDATSALSIELARRGYVVLSIDQYGHGETTVGMVERGYVNRSVSQNFGVASWEDGTISNISGPVRFRILMNFANLSFFNDEYSRDDFGNSIRNSSMGGIAAYAAMADMDFVDETRMSVGGHSMGTWSSWSVAAAFSGATNVFGYDISPRALILQAGDLFTSDVFDYENISFNNVLLLQAKYDEFQNFRDFNNTVTQDLPQSPLRSEFLGVAPAQGAWNTTFGSFQDGTARRMELFHTNHRLVAVHTDAIALSAQWLDLATGHVSPIPETNQTFSIHGSLVFASMLLSLVAMLALMELLFKVPFLSYVQQEIPARPHRVKIGIAWWRPAIITILIAGLTYPFMTQLGHGLLPLPENIFRMTIGNGFFAWYLLLIVIMVITTLIPWRKSRKKGSPIDFYDIGLAGAQTPGKFDWILLGKSTLLALAMTALVYILVLVFNSLFLLDFRIIWPFFRPFSLTRILQFLVYIPIFSVFFILNNSKILAGLRPQAAGLPGIKAFLSCWWRNMLCMAGGIALVCLIQYVPFFLDIGPGADLLFGSTFGGPFMSLLLIFFPQVIVLSALCTYIHRRTGHVFASGQVAAILSCWIITGGSPFLH